MKMHWDFFKESDTSMGVFYPLHYVMAAFDNEARAGEIRERFLEAGFREDDVAAVDGPFVAERLESMEDSSVLEKMGQELVRAVGTELGYVDDDLKTARRGGAFLFAYTPDSTAVDSTIDEAIAARKGVCQDFSHIMLALTRRLGIPCRYVSGYLYHLKEAEDRSATDASHAWVEAYLPELGWVGFDPTNNLIAAERHIRVAVGRDYADVPPTRGIFKGEAETDLTVAVRVNLADAPPPPDELLPSDSGWDASHTEDELTWQQQQQQQ